MGLEDFYTGRTDIPGSGIEGLEYGFADRLYDMLLSMPEHLQGQVTILSANRTIEHQQQLWDQKLAEYGGDVARTRRMVAPPGKSNHNHGMAADLTYHSNAARIWFHENAKRFGLEFPMSWEDWHIEPLGKRDGTYKPTGRTWGGGEHRDMPTSPEAYTDEQGLTIDQNNGDLETQLLRVADAVLGGRTGIKEVRRGTGVQKMADRNIGIYDG